MEKAGYEMTMVRNEYRIAKDEYIEKLTIISLVCYQETFQRNMLIC